MRGSTPPPPLPSPTYSPLPTNMMLDLDYLYKHCLFAVIRVRDNKDFDFLDGVIDVLSNLTEGWERVGLSIKKDQSFLTSIQMGAHKYIQ